MSKKYLVVATGIVVVGALMSGCTIGSSNEKTSAKIEKIDVSLYESKMVEGQFDGVMNTKFVDIQTSEKKEMYKVAEGLIEEMGYIKQGSTVKFSYKYDKEELQNVITGIVEVNGSAYVSPVKNENDVVEEITKVDDQVAYEPIGSGTMKVGKKSVEKYMWEIEGVYTSVPTYFERNEDDFANGNIKIKFHLVEDTPANDTLNERWRAASVLGEIGKYYEITDVDDDVKFKFAVEAKNIYKEILLLKKNERYIRVEWEAKNKEKALDVINAIINETK